MGEALDLAAGLASMPGMVVPTGQALDLALHLQDMADQAEACDPGLAADALSLDPGECLREALRTWDQGLPVTAWLWATIAACKLDDATEAIR